MRPNCNLCLYVVVCCCFIQVKYYVVNSEGKDYFEVNEFTGEIFTKIVFDREKQGAYALAIEARDSAPSARPNSAGQPNTGNEHYLTIFSF